jgi:hypothetical protein
MLRRAARDAAEHGAEGAEAGRAEHVAMQQRACAGQACGQNAFGQRDLLQPLPVVQARFGKQTDQGARAGARIVGPVLDAAPAAGRVHDGRAHGHRRRSRGQEWRWAPASAPASSDRIRCASVVATAIERRFDGLGQQGRSARATAGSLPVPCNRGRSTATPASMYTVRMLSSLRMCTSCRMPTGISRRAAAQHPHAVLGGDAHHAFRGVQQLGADMAVRRRDVARLVLLGHGRHGRGTCW